MIGIKEKLKEHFYKYGIVYYILYIPYKILQLIYKNLSDENFIKIKYKKIIGKDLNLKSPVRFTEKIQWLKLYDRRDIYTKCADKYLVRDYVKEKIAGKYLIPLVLVTENYIDINAENLPDYPVIVKTNHDSGGTFIIEDKQNFDFEDFYKKIKKRLKYNFYYLNREWEYKNIKPKIIVEKLMRDYTGNRRLNDYKIHCFHGKPMFIQTIFDRENRPKENWYDTEWRIIDVYYFSPIRRYIKKPDKLNELLLVSEKLSEDFPYVRVDLYIVNEQVYFGELTFRPYGGFMKFVPDEFDEKLGKYLDLKKVMIVK